MEEVILKLCKQYGGEATPQWECLPLSGSARKYYRVRQGEKTYMAVYHTDITENQTFVDFSRHFRQKGLPVPEIYEVSEDKKAYLQEDLGRITLLDAVEQERKDGSFTPALMELYRQALSVLLRFQFVGGEGLDYSRCIPRKIFDRRCILWDLNYFKYCFLRLAGAGFSENALEDDFEALTAVLCEAPAGHFMFRDFQSRNIMVREGKLWFIDYQGGRQGALPYDVASLLYDAIIEIPEQQREELLEGYIRELQNYQKTEAAVFRRWYYPFVLVRLLQAMGAFGLRGLYEGKEHFRASILPGLQNIFSLFDSGKLGSAYPEIFKVICQLKERGRWY